MKLILIAAVISLIGCGQREEIERHTCRFGYLYSQYGLVRDSQNNPIPCKKDPT